MRHKNRNARSQRTVRTSVLDQLEPRVLFTGVIENTSIDGAWFWSGMNQGSDVAFDNNDVMSVGPIVFAWDTPNSEGDIVSADLRTVAGVNVAGTGHFTLDSDGTLTLSLTFDPDADANTNNDVTQNYVGALNSTKDVITLTIPGTTLTAGILVKGTNSAFALTDLSGTWAVFNNGETAASTSSGTLNFNGQGQITGGTIKSGAETLTVLAGAYSITSAGVVRASVFTTGPSGQKTFEYAGQMNPSRDIVGLHPQDLPAAKTDGDPLFSTWVRRAGTTTQPNLAGDWSVSGDGFGGVITIDSAGKITAGSITNAAGHVIANPTGKLTISGTTLTLNLTLKDGNVTTNIVETGALNAARNIGAVQKAPSSTSGDTLTLLSRFGNHAPTLTKVTPFTKAVESTPFTITFAQLLAASNAFDVDNDTLGIVIQSVSTGTVTVNNVAVVPGTTTIHAGDSIVWTAPAGSGVVPAFKIRLTDGVATTANDVQVSVTTAKLPVVSIVATKKTATEAQGKPNNFVQYRISRTGGVLSAPLLVKFTTGGTANHTLPIDGSAFTTTSAIANPGSITIPANKSFILITLTPLDNAVADSIGYRDLTLTLAAATGTIVSNAYTITPVVAQKSATIKILDHNEPPTINITGNVTGAHINTPFDRDYDDLVDDTNADDREDATLTFKVRAIIGTLKKNGQAVTGTVNITDGDTLTWVPPATAHGVVNALSISVSDGFSATPFKTLKIVLT
jgi:hypothetical protein